MYVLMFGMCFNNLFNQTIKYACKYPRNCICPPSFVIINILGLATFTDSSVQSVSLKITFYPCISFVRRTNFHIYGQLKNPHIQNIFFTDKFFQSRKNFLTVNKLLFKLSFKIIH